MSGAETVGSVMHAAVTCTPDESIEGIAALIVERDVHAVIVVDKDGRPVGIVSGYDLLRTRGRDILELRARDFMRFPVITALPQEDTRIAGRRMMENGVHRVAVVDEAGRLEGVVTTADIVRQVALGHVHTPSLWRRAADFVLQRGRTSEQVGRAGRRLRLLSALTIAAGVFLAMSIIFLPLGVLVALVGALGLLVDYLLGSLYRYWEVRCPYCDTVNRVIMRSPSFMCRQCQHPVRIVFPPRGR